MQKINLPADERDGRPATEGIVPSQCPQVRHLNKSKSRRRYFPRSGLGSRALNIPSRTAWCQRPETYRPLGKTPIDRSREGVARGSDRKGVFPYERLASPLSWCLPGTVRAFITFHLIPVISAAIARSVGAGTLPRCRRCQSQTIGTSPRVGSG